jgi:DNA recombination protein RmuC
MIYLYLIAGLIALLLIIILIVILKPNKKQLNDDLLQQLNTQIAVQEQKIRGLQEEKLIQENKNIIALEKVEKENKDITTQLSLEKQQVAKLEEAYKAQQIRLKEQEIFVAQAQERFAKDFELIASQILKQKTAEFTETNRSNLDILLNPLKENIKAFEDKVEKVYKSESDERNVLKGEISKLMELNKQISDEAHQLSRALKGDNKKQGNWGEMVLDKLMEGSGLIEGTNYSKQSSFTDESGSRLQPDVIIYLPEEKHLVIDAKVSLVAYEKLINAETDEDRLTYTKQHITSIKAHISGLSSKNYYDLYQINSPEFVLLFMPIESSFALAIQFDKDLFEFAWNRRVVLVTPSTLLATLKTVASIWKQEQQTKNAIDIATKAGQLYDKFVGFINDLEKVGDHINKSQKVYGDAMNKLTLGNGNLVSKVETLKKLGAKNTKDIDAKFLEE